MKARYMLLGNRDIFRLRGINNKNKLKSRIFNATNVQSIVLCGKYDKGYAKLNLNIVENAMDKTIIATIKAIVVIRFLFLGIILSYFLTF
jgi:hypothetical protein